jgi:hypothetical protein
MARPSPERNLVMTLTNKQRSDRCAKTLIAYSEGDLHTDLHTNLVDWLADAMHWCHRNDHDIAAAFDVARTHFVAELDEEAREGN